MPKVLTQGNPHPNNHISSLFKEKLKKAGIKGGQESRWKGPSVSGVSYSSLSKWKVCPERFRLERVEGWRAEERWNKPIGFGELWHTCEEHYSAGNNWKEELKKFAQIQCRKHPLDQEQIIKFYEICNRQFDVYLDYYYGDEFAEEAQEKKIRLKYYLPSGDFVFINGYIDGVKKSEDGISVWENKTKGEINEEAITNRLLFDDMQTMMYCVALKEEYGECPKSIIYNVVKRPLSGGKGTIRQRKPTKSNPRGESSEKFFDRLINDYIKKEPESFFKRFEIPVAPHELARFEKECLQPLLQQHVNWWKSIENDPFNPWYNKEGKPNHLHFRSPSGIYNPLAEGRNTDLDTFIMTGNSVGLKRKI